MRDRIQHERPIGDDGEMFRTFNMGAGMVLAGAPGDADLALASAPGSGRIGEVVAGAGEASVIGLTE